METFKNLFQGAFNSGRKILAARTKKFARAICFRKYSLLQQLNKLLLHKKMKLSIKEFFSKCDQSLLQIRSHLLKKSLMENFMFCVVYIFGDVIHKIEKLHKVPYIYDPYEWEWRGVLKLSMCLCFLLIDLLLFFGNGGHGGSKTSLF